MTLWIAWALGLSSLIAVAAAAVERAAASLGVPRRFGWIAAMVATTVVPLAIALRPAPAKVLMASVAPTGVSGANADRISTTAPESNAHAVMRASGGTLTARPATGRALPGAAAWTARWRDAMVNGAGVVVRRADVIVARAWLLTSLALLVAFVRAVLRLRRQRLRWREADTGMGRVLVAHRAGPAVVGFVRPRIVIPQWALTLERSAQELLLRHEMEHIQAGDQRALLGARLLLIAFPWNGALWWMMSRLRLAIEMDCDARVIRAVGGAHEYGLVLLAVGERYATALPLAASLVEPRLSLEERIDAMTTPRPRRPVIASLPFAASAFVVLTAASQAPRPEPLRVAHVAVIHPNVVDAKVIDATAPAGRPDSRTSMSSRRVPSIPPLSTRKSSTRPRRRLDRIRASRLVSRLLSRLVSPSPKSSCRSSGQRSHSLPSPRWSRRAHSPHSRDLSSTAFTSFRSRMRPSSSREPRDRRRRAPAVNSESTVSRRAGTLLLSFIPCSTRSVCRSARTNFRSPQELVTISTFSFQAESESFLSCAAPRSEPAVRRR